MLRYQENAKILIIRKGYIVNVVFVVMMCGTFCGSVSKLVQKKYFFRRKHYENIAGRKLSEESAKIYLEEAGMLWSAYHK